jgi:hypothetical protein
MTRILTVIVVQLDELAHPDHTLLLRIYCLISLELVYQQRPLVEPVLGRV